MAKYRIKIKDEAVNDLNDAVLWYNEQQAGLGNRFQHHVISQINILSDYPFNNSICFENVRGVLIKRFPFVIHYKVNDIEKNVEIFSIFHTSRNPKDWNSRLK